MRQFLSCITIAVAVIIVAVPEGLLVATSVCTALAVNRMKRGNILVKNLEVPAMQGGVSELVTHSTGCLTQNKMKIHSFYLQGGADGKIKCYENKTYTELKNLCDKGTLSQDHADTLIKCI